MFYIKFVKSPNLILYLKDFSFNSKELIFTTVYSKSILFVKERDFALGLIKLFIDFNSDFKNLEIDKEY